MITGFHDPLSIPAPSATPVSGDVFSDTKKSPTAFRTISEVADDVALPQHVLRFWESKFQQIKPLKRGGGRRYYRPEDVQVIHDIKDLLYNQGFTIKGVQKLLREKSHSQSLARSMVVQPQLPMTVAPVAVPQPVKEHETTATVTTAPAPRGISAHTLHTPELSPIHRREIEGVLAELRSLRKLLQQSGI